MDQVTAWAASQPLWVCYLLLGVLALIFSRKSQVDAWVEANPRIGGFMKTLRGLGLDPWVIVQGLCLIFLGRLPKMPDVKPKAKLPPPFALILLVMVVGYCTAVGAILSCASLPPPPSKAQMIEASEAIAFNEAAVALALLDDAEAKRLDAITHPTDEQITRATARVGLLRTARDCLQAAREWILGANDLPGPALIQQAFDALRQVVASVKAEGGTVPSAVDKALEMEGKYL